MMSDMISQFHDSMVGKNLIVLASKMLVWIEDGSFH